MSVLLALSDSWLPILPPERILPVLLEYFRFDKDQFFCVRSSTITEIVARANGVQWSSSLSQACAPVLVDMGCRPISCKNRRLWAGVRPASMELFEAAQLAAELRGQKLVPRRFEVPA